MGVPLLRAHSQGRGMQGERAVPFGQDAGRRLPSAARDRVQSHLLPPCALLERAMRRGGKPNPN
eukprot:5529145-Lingulodinium_polyedra.AAC.1